MFKRFLCFSLCSALALATEVMAQTNLLLDPYTSEPLPTGAPLWMRQIADNPSGVNFRQMDSLFNLWMATDVNARIKTLDNKPAVNFYRRWRKAYQGYVGTDGLIHLPTMQQHMDQLEQQNQRTARRAMTRGAATARWRNIGPNTTTKEGNKPKDSQVCVYRLAVSRTNPNTVYCGTETGVVFKTTDKGQSWLPCNALHNFGGPIFALQVDPQNSDIVYAGGGQNLWKSTDGGHTWQMLRSVVGRVNSIRISPQNSQVITLCTGITRDQSGQASGFYISTDGGEHFEQTLQGVCHDHELQPGNPSRIYLVAKQTWEDTFSIYVSQNGGQTFDKCDLPISSISAGRLAVSEAPTGKDYVYALVNASYTGVYEGPYGGLGQPYILRSTDAGQHWTDQTLRGGYKTTFSPFVDEPLGGQGYFDMIIGVSANNPEHVIYGLCSSYRSTEGGKSWYRETAIGGYQKSEGMHPDMQDIVVCGNDTWISTDGGIKYSDDFFATAGKDCNKGIYASDYVGFGQGWNEDVMAGGRWHNGNAVMTAQYGEGNSLHISGVEQSTGYVMLSNPNKVYFSDGGMTVIPARINGAIGVTYDQFRDKKPMESLQTSKELGFDPRYAQRLIMNSSEDFYKLYVSEDEGYSFRDIFEADGEFVACYEFSRSNPNHIYVVCAQSIRHSLDNGLTWEELPTKPFEEVSMGGCAIAVDPHDENTLWYSNSSEPGHVAYTTDAGATWHYPLRGNWDMEGRKFNWIVLTGNEYHGVYLNTTGESKIYYQDDKTNGWIDYSEGFPTGARITRLVPFFKDGKLRAATNQGIWEIPLYREQFVPVAQPMALNLGNGDITATPNKEILFDSYSIVNHKGATWQWAFSPQPLRVTGAHTRSPKVVFGKKGSYAVTLTVTTPQGSHSRTIQDMIRIDSPTAIDQPSTPEVPVTIRYDESNPTLVLQTDKLKDSKTLTLHDAKGRLLHKTEIPANEGYTEIPLKGYAQGIYIYHLHTKHYKYFGKFLKK